MFIQKRKRSFRILLKSFIITTVSVCGVILIGRAAFNRTVVPPPIPPTTPLIQVVRAENPNRDRDNSIDDYDEVLEEVWPMPERFTNEDRREKFWTFLVIGLNEGTNANTIMVASYDGVNREANLISIPRDVPINVNRRGRKISSSYIVGAGGDRGRAGGVTQMQLDVMSIIGFVPDFYVVLDYDAFFTIIDAVGGVEIYVPFHMRYNDPYQDLFIDIPPGLQQMDSETALHFARFRQANRGSGFQSITDFGRIENQQIVVNAVIESLLSPASLLRIPEFVNIFNESVYTNLTFQEMMWFALELNHVRSTDALSSYTMPISHSSRAPMWYELLYVNGTIELINNTINPFDRDIEVGDTNIARE